MAGANPARTSSSEWEKVDLPYRGWVASPPNAPWRYPAWLDLAVPPPTAPKRPKDDPDTPRPYVLAAVAVAVLAFAVYKCPSRRRGC